MGFAHLAEAVEDPKYVKDALPPLRNGPNYHGQLPERLPQQTTYANPSQTSATDRESNGTYERAPETREEPTQSF